MKAIRLYRHGWELRGTLYFEFQPGTYAGEHWQPGSVFVYEEFWADLGAILARREPRYSHYAFTPIARETWTGILAEFDALATGLKAASDRQASASLLPHLFRSFELLEITFWRRHVLQYAAMTRDLAAWVRAQLAMHEVVSVLGI